MSTRRMMMMLVVGVVLGLGLAAPAAGQDNGGAALYWEARDMLAAEDFRGADRGFGRFLDRYPDSEYAGDALYWRAFALYRLGGNQELNRALDLLEQQQEDHADAPTFDDGRVLVARIDGQLARRGDNQAAQRVVREAEDSGSSSRGSGGEASIEMKMAALNALLQMDSERAMPILEKVLRNRTRETEELRAKAVFLVSQQDEEAATELLLEVVREDPSVEVQEQAVFWLSQVGGDAALDAIEHVLDTSDSRGIQDKAVFALSQHESPRAAELLRQIAEDPNRDTEIRANAIFWLGQRSGSAAEYLIELYPSLKDPELKEKVIFSISQSRSDESYAFLSRLARDRSEPTEVRKNAIFWMGQIDDIRPEDMRGLYDSSDDVELRKQIIFVLSQMDSRDAVEQMIEIARTDPDRELRENAVFWLGQSDDPRALEFLEELIGQ